MIELAGNHLWQSTLFAAIAGLLVMSLRNNRAQIRYWVWLVASVKFLVPFAMLMSIGGQLGWQSAPIHRPDVAVVMQAVSQPFSQPDVLATARWPESASHGESAVIPILLFATWLCGCVAVGAGWWIRWRQIATVIRTASPVRDGPPLNTLRRLEANLGGISTSVAVVASNASLEPGVFGILNPVLVWPRSLAARLDAAQVEAILLHELCHVRRRDNLAAAVHMVVEAVFWFHPLVWWLGTRLVNERERACDEEVIRSGHQPGVYAESILKTCEYYVESRLACVAGVTGSNLNKRIETIMTRHTGAALSVWKRLFLGAATVCAVAVPVIVGALNTPRLRAQSPATAADNPKFEVASIKLNQSADQRVMFQNQPGGRFRATNVTVRMLIRNAYQLQDFQLLGGPDWLNSDRFDVVAKGEDDSEDGVKAAQRQGPSRMQLMIRALLAERFRLTVHNDSRDLPIYALVLARRDGKLGAQLQATTVDCGAMFAAGRGRGDGAPQGAPQPGERQPCGIRIAPGNVRAGAVTMSQLANTLSMWAGRMVLDRTGLTGNFDIDLQWTPEQMPQRPAGAPEMPPIDPNGPSLFTAVQEQLGLKLDSQHGPVAVLVIDHVERPTEN